MDALLSDPIPTAIECSVLVLWCLFLRSFPRVAGGYTVLIAAALSTLQPEHRGPAVTGQETMFAAVFASGFTHGVRIARVPVPSHTSGEVLVRVQAAGLNPSNFKIDMSKIPFMRLLRTPIVGHDCAGVAVSVGSGTECKGFSTGDALYGFAAGSIAEFAVLSCGKAAQKSHVFSAAEAAGLPVASLTSLNAMQRSATKAGQNVLVLGASGGCGVFGVLIAKMMGASVPGVCSSRNTAFVRSLGADSVVNYNDESQMQTLAAAGPQFDVVYDTVTSFAPEDPDYEPIVRPLLKEGGRFVAINGAVAGEPLQHSLTVPIWRAFSPAVS